MTQNTSAAVMARDRTLTANQIEHIRSDISVLMAHKEEIQSLKQRGWGIMLGLMIAAAAAGVGLKALITELLG